jgi:hypothetical protein
MDNYKAELIEKLDSNLNYLFENPEGKRIEQIIEYFAIVDQCMKANVHKFHINRLYGHNRPSYMKQSLRVKVDFSGEKFCLSFK